MGIRGAVHLPPAFSVLLISSCFMFGRGILTSADADYKQVGTWEYNGYYFSEITYTVEIDFTVTTGGDLRYQDRRQESGGSESHPHAADGLPGWD